MALEPELRDRAYLAGHWVVGTLGVNKIESLARQAKNKGLDQIQADALLEVLPGTWAQ